MVWDMDSGKFFDNEISMISGMVWVWFGCGFGYGFRQAISMISD